METKDGFKYQQNYDFVAADQLILSALKSDRLPMSLLSTQCSLPYGRAESMS